MLIFQPTSQLKSSYGLVVKTHDLDLADSGFYPHMYESLPTSTLMAARTLSPI